MIGFYLVPFQTLFPHFLRSWCRPGLLPSLPKRLLPCSYFLSTTSSTESSSQALQPGLRAPIQSGEQRVGCVHTLFESLGSLEWSLLGSLVWSSLGSRKKESLASLFLVPWAVRQIAVVHALFCLRNVNVSFNPLCKPWIPGPYQPADETQIDGILGHEDEMA